MALRTLSLACFLAACLLGCGGGKPEAATCEFNPVTNNSDCADGLFCQHPTRCTEVCEGVCAKSCETDADCPGRACSGRSTPETGSQKFCR